MPCDRAVIKGLIMSEPYPSQTAKAGALFKTIASQIEHNGPITMANYISLALGDADHGYYHKQDPFGADGDFTTAPEISGLFGEMCGLYLAHMADLSGLGQPAILELGPGRGSLMADMRHVWPQIMSQLTEAPVHLVETSPALRQRQKDRLAPADLYWHTDLDDLPATPIFGIANEFFDALPIDQAIWREGQNGAAGVWRHRLVGLVDGRLGFVDGAPLSKAEIEIWNLASRPAPTDGSIAEYCAIANAYAAKLATHIASYGGACLIIDYGRDGPSGDSLQGVANHQPVDVFHQPGDADLSHWVDFSASRQSSVNNGARLAGPVTQGYFLRAIGIAQRTEAVAKLADAETRRGLFAAVDRLVSSQQMGSAFKVAMILPPGNGLPLGFAVTDKQGPTT